MNEEEQENELEVNEPEAVEAVEEEIIADEPEVEADDDAEVTGEDALAILAGDDEPEAEPEAEAEPEVKAEAEAEPEVEVEAKAEDSDDAEILESITNERTRERFQSLSHKNKELIQSSTQQTQIIDAFKDQVVSSGLSNEDFSQVVSLMGKANSTDINSVKEARAFIRDLDKTLTGRIGDTADAYEKFDDLKQDYEDGEASEKYVNQEAQRRIQDQATQNHQQQQLQREQQEQQQQQQAVKEQGGAIQSMVDQFRSTDPDFALKESQLEQMAMKVVQDGIPMNQWATEFVNRYHAINVSQRKPSPTPMSSSRQAQNVNNYASSNMTDEEANAKFAMDMIAGRG